MRAAAGKHLLTPRAREDASSSFFISFALYSFFGPHPAVLKAYSWQCLGNSHAERWEFNPCWLRARQALYPLDSYPCPFHFFSSCACMYILFTKSYLMAFCDRKACFRGLHPSWIQSLAAYKVPQALPGATPAHGWMWTQNKPKKSGLQTHLLSQQGQLFLGIPSWPHHCELASFAPSSLE